MLRSGRGENAIITFPLAENQKVAVDVAAVEKCGEVWCDCAEGKKGRLELIRRDNFRHAKRKQIIRRQITQRPRTKCEMQPQMKCLF